MRHSFNTLMRRLSRAGFKREFVNPAILPDWWDEDCEQDPSLLPDIELRVARFLGLSISIVQNAEFDLHAPLYPDAKLRRVRDIDSDRLAASIHSALQISGAVIRNLRDSSSEVVNPPPSALDWRQQLAPLNQPVTLDEIVGDLWNRGIPVIPIDKLPSPNFQGAACIVENRPVIVLGHKHDEPGHVAFIVSHETGHIAAGDCLPDQPVIDEEEGITDTSDIEQGADRYATQLLIGQDTIPEITGTSFRELANQAVQVESSTGADASAIIFTWARSTGEFGKATLAVKALYRHSGARKLLHQHFDSHVDVEAASESDRALLRCVYG